MITTARIGDPIPEGFRICDINIKGGTTTITDFLNQTGYCRKCQRWYSLPTYDERKLNAYCPDCGGPLSLTRKPLETVKTELALSKSELGERAGLVK